MMLLILLISLLICNAEYDSLKAQHALKTKDILLNGNHYAIRHGRSAYMINDKKRRQFPDKVITIIIHIIIIMIIINIIVIIIIISIH